MSIKDQLLNKKLLKKWWFWVIVVILIGVISALSSGNKKSDSASNNDNQRKAVTYTITGEVPGEYGQEVTLNKDSDMPNKEYLYKLPAGSYKVTTTSENVANFFVVKDEIKIVSTNDKYPEELDYTGKGYHLTSKDEKVFGKTKKEILTSLGADESVQIVGTDVLIFEKQ